MHARLQTKGTTESHTILLISDVLNYFNRKIVLHWKTTNNLFEKAINYFLKLKLWF